MSNDKSIIITLHESGHGPGHDLRDYFLKQKVNNLLFIAHPLLFIQDSYKKSSRYEIYKNGKLVKKEEAYHWRAPEPILYMKDIIYTLTWSLKFGKGSNLFIGLGNINAFSGYILRFLQKDNFKIIYYVIDYIPKRFANPLLNNLYHLVEKLAAEKSSWSWNLSPRMIAAREKKWKRKFKNQLVVPHGVHFTRIKRIPFQKINKYEIIFMGSLLKKQGIQLVIQSLPEILKKFPRTHLTIIGRGEFEKGLKQIVKGLSLERYVKFLGYIESHSEMENRLAKSGIAVALYNRKLDENDFTYFADPGKIKNYLGAGVPVLITDVPCVSEEVRRAQAGIVVEYSIKSIVENLNKYFSNENLMKKYRQNALAFAKRYEWDTLFSHALSQIFKHL